jgi:hypothetical protein
MWACATQNRQPGAPAADCRTRTHPLTAWWRLDRHQAVIWGRSQRPLSSNSVSVAILAPCLLKHDTISRCLQGPLTDAHMRLCDTGITYEGNITSRGETRNQRPSSLDCVRHLDLAHGGYITPLVVQLLFLASAQSLQSLCAACPTGAETRVSVVRASRYGVVLLPPSAGGAFVVGPLPLTLPLTDCLASARVEGWRSAQSLC